MELSEESDRDRKIRDMLIYFRNNKASISNSSCPTSVYVKLLSSGIVGSSQPRVRLVKDRDRLTRGAPASENELCK